MSRKSSQKTPIKNVNVAFVVVASGYLLHLTGCAAAGLGMIFFFGVEINGDSRIQQMEVLTNVPYANGQICEIPWNGMA